MSTKETGGPAFPIERLTAHGILAHDGPPQGEAAYIAALSTMTRGMTLRQYAAIKLKVPDSGTDWLDVMITKSLRDELAARAMQGFAADSEVSGLPPSIAEGAYAWADAMMEARAK